MERTLTWIRENPVLTGLGFGLLVLVFLTIFFAVLMNRADTSLRPIVWFVIFFAIVGGPQAVVHLLDALTLLRARQAHHAATTATVAETETAKENESAAATAASGLRPVPWPTVFGPDRDARARIDPKFAWYGVLHESTEALLTVRESGETVLAARFPSAQQAAKAVQAYGTFNQFAEAEGSDATGWTASIRGNTFEWAHVVAAGAEMYVWTGLTKEAVLAQRERALGPIDDRDQLATVAWAPSAEPLPTPPAHGMMTAAATAGHAPSPAVPRPELLRERLPKNTKVMIWFMGLNLLAATLWFFKGSAWAARIEPDPVASTAPAESLRRDLLALNRNPDLPTAVSAEPDGTISVEWRVADARWFDLMRVHQMKRVHRLVLIFDEKTQTVRVREYWSAFDASAGLGGLKLKWQKGTGIQFFQYEHKRVFGAQVDEHGRPTGAMSKAYTFNLQDLKRPLIERVVEAGWTWQPVTWNLPEQLRWLSE